VAGEEKNAAAREWFLHEAVAQLDHLYRVAFHIAVEADEADDLVQETYARAISSWEQFYPGSNMKAWLTRILYNLFFNRYHEKKRWVSIEDRLPAGTEDSYDPAILATGKLGPEGYALSRELDAKIRDGLRELPEEFRVSIVLVDIEDFSYAEVAEVLSCPVGTIRSRISRGRKLLHKYLKGYVETGIK